MNSPCLYCENRHFNCHSKCEKYVKFKSCFKSRDSEAQEYIGYVNGAYQGWKEKVDGHKKNRSKPRFNHDKLEEITITEYNH